MGGNYLQKSEQLRASGNGEHQSSNEHHQNEISDRVFPCEAIEVFSVAEHFRGCFSAWAWHVGHPPHGESDAARVMPLDLKDRVRCRGCGVRGRAAVSIK